MYLSYCCGYGWSGTHSAGCTCQLAAGGPDLAVMRALEVLVVVAAPQVLVNRECSGQASARPTVGSTQFEAILEVVVDVFVAIVLVEQGREDRYETT